ncbi:tetratricopeptide repeat protein [Nibrella viscosa]
MTHKRNRQYSGNGNPTSRFLVQSLLAAVLLAMMGSCSDTRQEEAAQFFLKGNIQLNKQEYREAIRFYTEAINKKPDFADAYNNRGLAKYRNGDLPGALADYDKAIDIDPNFEAAYLNRADVRNDLNDAQNSLADLQRIEKTYKDSAFYQARLGETYTRLNNLAPAQAAFDKAIRLDPNNAEALTNRGALLFQQKAYKLSQLDLERALQLNPKQHEALNNLSMILARSKNYESALAYVNRALEQKPNQPYYLNNKGYYLMMLDRDKEALPFLQESLQLDNQNAWAYRNMGIFYLRQKQAGQAIEALRKAEQLDSSVDQVYYYLGNAYQETDNLLKACETWQTGALAGDNQARQQRTIFCSAR